MKVEIAPLRPEELDPVKLYGSENLIPTPVSTSFVALEIAVTVASCDTTRFNEPRMAALTRNCIGPVAGSVNDVRVV